MAAVLDVIRDGSSVGCNQGCAAVLDVIRDGSSVGCNQDVQQCWM